MIFMNMIKKLYLLIVVFLLCPILIGSSQLQVLAGEQERELVRRTYKEYSHFASEKRALVFNQINLKKHGRTVTLLSEFHFADGDEAIKAKAVAIDLVKAAVAGDLIFLEDADASLHGGGTPEWVKNRLRTWGSDQSDRGGILFQLWKIAHDISDQILLLEPNSDQCPEAVAALTYERKVLDPAGSAYGKANLALLETQLDPATDATDRQSARDTAFAAFEEAQAEALRLTIIAATARSRTMAQTLEQAIPNEKHAFAIMGTAHTQEVLDFLVALGWSIVELTP